MAGLVPGAGTRVEGPAGRMALFTSRQTVPSELTNAIAYPPLANPVMAGLLLGAITAAVWVTCPAESSVQSEWLFEPWAAIIHPPLLSAAIAGLVPGAGTSPPPPGASPM